MYLCGSRGVLVVTYITTDKSNGQKGCFCSLTVAVAVVADSYGAAEEAGGPAEVTGAGVSDVVVAADGLLRRHGDLTRGRAAHDAVGAVGLVGDAGVGAWTHHVGARLCGEEDY